MVVAESASSPGAPAGGLTGAFAVLLFSMTAKYGRRCLSGALGPALGVQSGRVESIDGLGNPKRVAESDQRVRHDVAR